MLESDYQAGLIKRIEALLPGCIIQINTPRTPNYIQGFPDLTILYESHWGVLEVKRTSKAKHEPNQDYYIDTIGRHAFAAFIFPENEEEVLDALQHAFASSGHPRTS